jgi:Fur family zinc uptake transcriptional regulator
MHACQHHKKCISSALLEGEKICAQQGLRFTAIRRKVLEIIWQGHQPAKAYYILDQLSALLSSAKPATVYRALNFLLDNGLIHKINSLNAFVGCSHPCHHKQCFFLICKHCNEVSECCTSSLNEAILTTAQENAFTPEETSLEIQGICKSCSQEAKQ